MSEVGQFRYWWNKPRGTRPDGWQEISDEDIAHGGVKGPHIELMAEPGGHMPTWAWDLLQVARTAYVADKKSRRKLTADNWTRSIHIRVPVLDPASWKGRSAALLCELLQTLTADRWEVTLLQASSASGRQGRVIDNWTAAEVTLFSGGLDSTAFAADLARHRGGDALLVMFYEPATRAQQDATLQQICRVSRREIHMTPASQMVIGAPLEQSSRSRGMLYMATALYLAAAHGTPRVLLPENGQLAINLPLTPGRPAACSTRSAHPWTLSLLNQLISALGGDIAVINPLADRTKGEVCELALEAGLMSEALYSTVSCSHPPCKRNAQLPCHCGHCYPCLVRRSGLHHALGADRTRYLCDPWQLPGRDPKSDDLTDLLTWLSTPLTSANLIADLPLPREISLSDLISVQRRARQELSAMLGSEVPATGPSPLNWQPSP